MSQIDTDVQHVISILLGILNPDNQIRAEATKNFDTLKSNPVGLIFCLVECLKLGDKNTKILSSVLLRRLLDIENTDDDKQLWRKITPEIKANIKSSLIASMISENERFVKLKITDTLARVAENVLENDEDWTEILNLINQGFESSDVQNNSVSIECLLEVFNNIFKYLPEQLIKNVTTIISAFGRYFASNDLNLKTQTIKTISVIITNSKKKVSKNFQEFVPKILFTTNECLTDTKQENNLRANLTAINHIAERNFTLFSKDLMEFYKFVIGITEKKDFLDENLRELAFDIILTVLEKNKKQFKDETTLINNLIQRLFNYALEIENDISTDFLTPKSEDYIENEEFKEQKLEFASDTLDRIILLFGKEKIIPVISNAIGELVRIENDWRHKYIGLIITGDICGYIGEEPQDFENILQLISVDINNSNPKIRYAAVHCINQLSEKLKKEFNEATHGRVIALLLAKINDPVLRIQLHSLEALQNFMEFVDSESIQPHVSGILDAIFAVFFKEDIVVSLRLCILNTISELVDCCKEKFKPYSEKTLKILLDFFVNVYTKKILPNTYGHTLEAITLIGETNEEVFVKFVPDLLKSIVDIHTSISTDSLGKDYLINSLERLCPFVKDSYPDSVKDIIDAVLKLVEVDPKISLGSLPQNSFKIEEVLNDLKGETNKPKKFNLQTTEIEEKETALQLLHAIIETFDSLVIPYVNRINKVIIPLLPSIANDSIRSESGNVLPPIIRILKKQENKEECHNLARLYVGELFKAMEKEKSNITLKTQLENTSDILEEAGQCILELELNILFDKVLFIFSETEKRRKDLNKEHQETTIKSENNLKNADEEDLDESDDGIGKILEEEIEEIEEVLISISDFIGSMFKSHKPLVRQIVDKITTHVLPSYLKATSTNFELKMGIFIIDDLIEFLGQEYLNDSLWKEIAALLIKFCDHKEPSIRQASSYGIGLLAQFTKSGFELFINDCLNAISSGLQLNSDGEDEEEFLYAKDNLIASVGKIIKHQYQFVPNVKELLNIWVANLPILNDKGEAKNQHALLCEIILKNNILFSESDLTHLPKIIKILAKVYHNDFATEETQENILSIFKTIWNTQVLNDVYLKTEGELDNKLKKKIEIIRKKLNI